MHNYWIAVSDLLSGFVVVCLLMFVSANISSQITEQLRHLANQDLEQALLENENKLAEINQLKQAQQAIKEKRVNRFIRLKETLHQAEMENLVLVDPKTQTVELKDISFPSGSACLSEKAKSVLDLLHTQIVQDMELNPELNIYIEGHTDPTPVGGTHRSCGLFETNTQLSTLRASNVRTLLLSSIPEVSRVDTSKRMPVTGWGADRLKDEENPNSAVNRRVELRWVWENL